MQVRRLHQKKRYTESPLSLYRAAFAEPSPYILLPFQTSMWGARQKFGASGAVA
jgi:hypothetical protein